MTSENTASNTTSNLKANEAKHTIVAVLFMAFIVTFGAALILSGFPREFLTEYRNTVPVGTPVFQRIESAIDIFDSTITEDVPQHDNFIEFYGEAQVIMGKRTVPDPNYGYLYKTSDGQITYVINKRDMKECSDKVGALKKGLEAEGIHNFLWVLAPFKLMDDTTITPITFDYGDENCDEFLTGLDRNGVDYLDLRGAFHAFIASGMTQNELFFNTDHHWTIPSALKATGIIADTLDNRYGMHIDRETYDAANYSFKTFKNYYIGSMGRRVGVNYGGIDDFTLVLPKFETSIKLTQTDYGVTTSSEGSFYDAVIVKDYLDNPDPTTNRYAAYHGDNTELVFENNLVKDGKVLIVKDSFGVPVYSFLSLGVHEVRALDPRLFKGSILEYAREYDPDVVIFLYNGDSLNSNMFQWTL